MASCEDPYRAAAARADLISGKEVSMDSPVVFFELAEIAGCLRCIALSISERASVRLRHAERMASAQFDAVPFRLSGRGVF